MLQDAGTLLGVAGQWLESVGLDPGSVVRRASEAAVILILAWVGLRVARRVTTRYENKVAEDSDDTMEFAAQRARTIAQLVNSVATVAIYVTTLLLLLNLFIPIGPLLAGVGVFGLALSFGAQSLVKDVISGFFMLSENQFAVGDVVEIEGVSGAVERITLRVVMLRDLEGVLHIIPNGTITRVSNRTRGWSRAVLDVGVAYGEDIDRVIEVLNDVSRAFFEDEAWRDNLDATPQVMGVQDLADSAVVLRIRIDTRPGKQWEVKREFRRRIKNRLDHEGIEIPFPQRTLHHRQRDGGGGRAD